jgi:MoaA/NifB/PqqE/SkfB family radical SAM enzyme
MVKCVMPWKSYGFHSDGTFVPCGFVINMPFENIPIENRHNSEIMKQIRNDFINNKFPKNCLRCEKDEELGKKSLRLTVNEQFILPNKLTEFFDQAEILDLNFSNICNSKCIMCTPRCSSAIASEVKNKNVPIHYKGKNLKSELNFDIVKPFLKNAKRINLRGGEPLLDINNKKVLQHLVENNLSPQLNIVTNLSVWDEEFFDLTDKLKAKIKISIDGLDNVFKYIRYPLKFSIIEENLIKLQQFQHIKQLINCTVQLFNICELGKINEYFNIPINFEILRKPEYFQANITDKKEYILNKLQLLKNHNQYDELVNFIQQENKFDKEQLKFALNYFNTTRNLNYKDVIDKEIVGWIDE